jgi:ATP-dependent helicase YprA (DUF1998 family)
MRSVAESLPVDQYYVNNPQKLLDGQVDELIVDLDNKILLEGIALQSNGDFISKLTN